MTWDRYRIASEIRGAAATGRVDRQRLEHITRAVSTAPPREAFEGLAAIISDPKGPDDNFIEQEYAGAILLSVMPPCGEPVETVTRLLARWNRSVEQIPQYLEKVLGREALAQVLDDAPNDVLDTRIVGTVRWWLHMGHGDNAPPN